MRKKLLIILLGLTLSNGFSQTEICEPILKKDFLEKIKGYKPTDLVPYNVINNSWEEKWGLMDKKSKKKLTAPLMNYAATFKPYISFFFEECDVKINSNYELKAEDLMIWSEEVDESVDPGIQILDSINGYRGFKVDENGKLTGYSKAYFRDNWHSWNISTPFFYKNEYYAIVQNSDGKKVIINTKGAVKNESVYNSIRYTEYKFKGENLLYVEDLENNRGFITLSGKKILYGKLLKSPFYHNELFGYSMQHDGMRGGGGFYADSISKSGVLDLTKMKWLIEPKEGLKIIDMCYASDSVINTDYTNRKAASIYFIVLEDKLRYLIDEKGNKYIAK
jgi:hypothetical protein